MEDKLTGTLPNAATATPAQTHHHNSPPLTTNKEAGAALCLSAAGG